MATFRNVNVYDKEGNLLIGLAKEKIIEVYNPALTKRINVISLKKDSYVSNQKIINKNDYIIKLVELNNFNFVSIMRDNYIKFMKKQNSNMKIQK